MTAAALARRPQARLVRETASGVRTHSLVAFWAVVLLALPLWWGSTAVERLSLPALSPAARAQFESRLMRREIVVELPGRRLLEVGLQEALDELDSGSAAVDELLTVRLGADDGSGDNLQLVIADSAHELATIEYSLETPLARAAERILDALPSFRPGSREGLSTSSSSPPIKPPPPPPPATDSRVVPYAPELHLRFTLLLEDVADRDAGPDEPVDWAIESALRSVVGRSLTDRLGPVHNVSFSSQVQYHSPLAVVPFPAVAGRRGWTVGADDVKAFVNSEEWTLGAEGAAGGAVGPEPARTELDLMVFVPKASRRPLALEIEGSAEVAYAFLIPQVGSVVIFNPPDDPHDNDPSASSSSSTIEGQALRALLQRHVAHLRVLIGLPPLALGHPSSSSSSSSLGRQHPPTTTTTTDEDEDPRRRRRRRSSSAGWPSWRADLGRLARRRTAEQSAAALGTLDALGRLLAANSELRVGRPVREAVGRSVDLLEQLAAAARAPTTTTTTTTTTTAAAAGSSEAAAAPRSWSPAPPPPPPPPASADLLALAVEANRLASEAFFAPSLMGLLYFPAEHKYAVYAPLLAPVGVPLLVGAVKEVRRRRKARRAPSLARVGEGTSTGKQPPPPPPLPPQQQQPATVDR